MATSSGAALATGELVIVSAITQAVLVLPMRSYFHRAAILGLPANVLVLPLAGTMLNSGAAAIALSYVSMPLARTIAAITAAALHWTLLCLNWLAQLGVSRWRVPGPTPAIAALAAAGVIIALIAARQRRAVMLGGMAALLASAGTVAFFRPAPRLEKGKLEITAIDVRPGRFLAGGLAGRKDHAG